MPPIDARGLIECAVLPLRDVVLYPNMVTPLFVGHEPTLQAIEDATRGNADDDRRGAARPGGRRLPAPEDLYPSAPRSPSGA